MRVFKERVSAGLGGQVVLAILDGVRRSGHLGGGKLKAGARRGARLGIVNPDNESMWPAQEQQPERRFPLCGKQAVARLSRQGRRMAPRSDQHV